MEEGVRDIMRPRTHGSSPFGDGADVEHHFDQVVATQAMSAVKQVAGRHTEVCIEVWVNPVLSTTAVAQSGSDDGRFLLRHASSLTVRTS